MTKLDYSSPSEKRPRNAVGWTASGGFICGILTPPALLLAIISGGLGHGDYVFARAFFPLPMLATLFTGDRISNAIIAAAVLQLPLYGLIIGFSLSRRSMIGLPAVAFIHGLALIGCFSGLLPNFS